MLRTVLFWLHLIAGVSAGLVVLVMSATGALLTYERQMVAWADRTDAAMPPQTSVARLSIDELMARARTVDPAANGLTLSSTPGAPALVNAGQRTFKMNAFTGAFLGESAPRLRTFFRSVTSWHRWLAVDGPARATARLFTGWGNVLFLVVVLGGPFIWLPKRWSLTQFRQIALFRGGLRGKARDFNWHNVIGIWSFVPLLLIVVSALPMSFPWANTALYRLVGEAPPAGRGAGAGAGAGAGGAAGAGPALEPAWSLAEQQSSGWRTISARFGGRADAPLAFTIDLGTGGQPQRRGTLTVDRATASVVRWDAFESQTTGRRLRTFFRFAHTGEYFGVIGQTIAGLASAGAVVLVWTGLALALRRFLAWRSRRSARTAPAISRHLAA